VTIASEVPLGGVRVCVELQPSVGMDAEVKIEFVAGATFVMTVPFPDGAEE
jgi:hypothetical protein